MMNNRFQKIFDAQKALFHADTTKSYEWRIEQLDRLSALLTENADALREAVGKDFKTSFAEQVFELEAPLATIEFTKSQLRDWMEPVQAPIPAFLDETGHKGMIYREPYGVTLVMGAFNGPLLLLLDPAITAISAGNPVILKLNNAIPATNALLLELIQKYFEPESVTAVTGNRDDITELLKLPFDFIFFTGSTQVGKVIMRAAAENLTPVLLELGGQNPVIVDQTADIADAATKIVWGATAWAGQWCTSPGYVCVHESVADQFAAQAKRALLDMYGSNPETHPDFSKIISAREVRRLASLIEPDKLIAGGDFDEESRYFAPTLLYPVTWSDKVMEDEIFGPILPIIRYSDIRDIVGRIKNLPKPLAGYVFSRDEETIAYLLNTLSFGGGSVNQVNVQLFIETMPFGGVGSSGLGHYYGKYGYDSLTHAKSILHAPAGQAIEHLIPPYTGQKIADLSKWFEY
jgi:aldehyde dehydrogenase (NAD+)